MSVFLSPLASSASDAAVVKRKGERWNPTAYFIPWQSLYTTGARLRAIENLRGRAANRAARRGSRR